MATKRQGLHNQWKLRMSVSCSDEPGDIDTYQGRNGHLSHQMHASHGFHEAHGMKMESWEWKDDSVEAYLIPGLRTPSESLWIPANLTSPNKKMKNDELEQIHCGFCSFGIIWSLHCPVSTLLSNGLPPSSHWWMRILLPSDPSVRLNVGSMTPTGILPHCLCQSILSPQTMLFKF